MGAAGSGRAVRRFLGALWLPIALVRTVLADPEARSLYRRVLFRQALVTVVIGAVLSAGLFWLVLWAAGQAGSEVTLNESGVNIHFGVDDSRPHREATAGVLLNSPARAGLGALYILFGVLTLVEAIVIALSRDYHDQIGRHAALLRGIPPEDPDVRPRVRLDLRWLWRRLKRKVRGVRVFVVGLPVLGIVSLVPVIGSPLYGALAFVWGLYWLAVFAGAKSALAWSDEFTAPDPWFLRAVLRVPVLRWYARVWRRFTRDVFAPCRRFEEAPFELGGLALARLIGTIPVLYLFMRPLLPVAAAIVITRGDREG